jgi:hypothetical protein
MSADYMESFGRAIAGRRPEVAARLLPGLPGDEVRRRLGDVPDQVVAWFEWCNGVDGGETLDDVAVIPAYYPLSLDEALGLIEIYEGDEELEPSFVPLLQGPGSNIYAAVWSDASKASVAFVVVEDDTEIRFASIRQMVAVFTACYERGVYQIDEDGYLTRNDDYRAVYDDVVSRVQ